MVGLIGLNGAGKSTTMKHILGLMNPQKGEIEVQGKRRTEDSEAYHSALGFVPESPLLYDELTVREHLEFTARSYGVSREDYESRGSSWRGCSGWRRRWTACQRICPKGCVKR